MDAREESWNDDAAQEALLVATRLEILRSQSAMTFVYPLILAGIATFLLWPVSPHGILLGWLTAVGVLTLFRFVMLARSRRDGDPAGASSWLTAFAVSAGLSGVLWGIAPMLLVPRWPDRLVETTLYNGFVALLTCGIAAGATMAYTASARVLLSFLLAALIPPALYFISFGDRVNGALGGFLLLYSFFTVVAGLRMNMQMHRYIDMEHKLKLLAGDLGARD